ncbi:uncharacterized protein EV422DRAFT_508732 [Fimicolochytrium jonesii]|uniref:uncharacterized protein n=1 Tax=Fimicolochytrium jonesii TaxID=1396493 RepID=UPI0022FE56AD|nr:uncharacterized protein EV422DRAFT_508732 [Fimicolochytrium jonesii]KAI8817643.1 hypothetical protein EV422DRAFT_508732 [Fimicolochytrium jonesii]
MTNPATCRDASRLLDEAIATLKRARVDATASHATARHRFLDDAEKVALRNELLAWYDAEQRIMPWRLPSGANMSVPDVLRDLARKYKYRRNRIWRSVPTKVGLNTYLPARAINGVAKLVWVSEIMLQQTQVATVIPFYKRWMAQWPTIFMLAEADGEDVHNAWAGLGYYSRARRLHEGAQLVVKKFNGRLPSDPTAMEKEVPGIGPYTAGAVASIAYNVSAPLVDGNVVRVLSRLRALAADPKLKESITTHWSLAKNVLDVDRPGHFNQALMDLGATICTPQNPECGRCPIKAFCHAHAEVGRIVNNSQKFRSLAGFATSTLSQTKAIKILAQEKFGKAKGQDPPTVEMEDICHACPPLTDIEDAGVTRYPAKAVKKAARIEACAVCILEHVPEQGPSRYLLMRGPKKGLLANLWDFPMVILESPDVEESQVSPSFQIRQASIDDWLLSNAGLDLLPGDGLKSEEKDDLEGSTRIQSRKDLGSAVHLFSHIRRSMHVEHIVVTGPLPAVSTALPPVVGGAKRKSTAGKKAAAVKGKKLKGKDVGKGKKKTVVDDNDEFAADLPDAGEDEPRELRWVTKEEMLGTQGTRTAKNAATVPVPATLKRAFGLLSAEGSGAVPKTRKRAAADPGAAKVSGSAGGGRAAKKIKRRRPGDESETEESSASDTGEDDSREEVEEVNSLPQLLPKCSLLIPSTEGLATRKGRNPPQYSHLDFQGICVYDNDAIVWQTEADAADVSRVVFHPDGVTMSVAKSRYEFNVCYVSKLQWTCQSLPRRAAGITRQDIL